MKTKLPAQTAAILLLAGLVVVAGCTSQGAGRRKSDPVLRLSAQESLVQGKDLLSQKKYSRARPLFPHAFEVEPN